MALATPLKDTSVKFLMACFLRNSARYMLNKSQGVR